MSKLNVSTPSGFPEFSPAEERIKQNWIRIIAEVFEKNGFMPITTPLVEREENLVAKGGNPKEMYVLKRLLDEEGDDSHSGMACRFDHTVPLALYVARHFSELSFPFKRYSIGPVLRGERAQKGRYRQFDQCDIDVIGSEHLSLLNDAQMPSIIIQIFERLNIGDFVVRINNRKILTGFFESLGIEGEKIKQTLDIVDDLEKIGHGKVFEQLEKEDLSKEVAQKILDFTEITGTTDEIFKKITGFVENENFTQGIEDLKTVVDGIRAMGVDENRFRVDLSIARGLDYYTGTVFETNLLNEKGEINKSLGSICSGGRFDDLAGVFTGRNLPGVGISIGLTRLLPQLIEAGIIKLEKSSPSDVLVIAMSEAEMPKALKIGESLRKAGIATENYLEAKKIGKQFDYADKLGIPYCIVIGEDEAKNNTVQLKNMQSGDQEEVKMGDLEEKIKSSLK